MFKARVGTDESNGEIKGPTSGSPDASGSLTGADKSERGVVGTCGDPERDDSGGEGVPAGDSGVRTGENKGVGGRSVPGSATGCGGDTTRSAPGDGE